MPALDSHALPIGLVCWSHSDCTPPQMKAILNWFIRPNQVDMFLQAACLHFSLVRIAGKTHNPH